MKARFIYHNSMVKLCNTCGKEFDEQLKGVRYSSSIREFYSSAQMIAVKTILTGLVKQPNSRTYT
jgi:hypothetical protein